MSTEKKELLSIAFGCWIVAVELIKILYIATCDCRGIGQPFNSWFFPAFQHLPYTFWWTYHGITWLAGPYSLIWWGLNAPAIAGYWGFFEYLIIFDLWIFVLLAQKSKLYACYYLLLTVWFTTVDPVDFFPVVFAVAGRYSRILLMLAPLTKLPVGAPLWVWVWTLTNRNSLQGAENYGRYLLLGLIWLTAFGFYLWDRAYRLDLICFEGHPSRARNASKHTRILSHLRMPSNNRFHRDHRLERALRKRLCYIFLGS